MYRQHGGDRGEDNWGHRGHRGQRGRGRYFHGGQGSQNDPDSAGDRGGAGRRGRRGGPPHGGLKGREIGMFYARRGQEKRKRLERETRPVVSMEGRQEAHIERLLHNIKAVDTVQPQPQRSGAALPDSSDEEDMDNFEGPSFSGGSQSATSTRPVHRQEFKTERTASASGSSAASSREQLSEGMEDMDITEEGVPNMAELVQYGKFEMDFVYEDSDQDSNFDQNDASVESGLDATLLEQFRYRQDTDKYRNMQEFRQKLPSYAMRQEIIEKISQNQCLVISGETGCGKTTQVTQFILDDYLERGCGSQCRIICTQPRRISAVSVAERVAAERAEDCGISCGYIIRLENKLPRQHGSITYCTTGILLKFLESDSLLKRATHVILDEVHERDLLTDFLMIILKDVMAKRPDLKVVLMSATLNAQTFSKYFYNSPILHIPGFTYPVKEYLLEDVIETLRYDPPATMLKKERGGGRMRGRKGREQQEQRDLDQWNLDAWLRNMSDKYSSNTVRTLRSLDMDEIDLTLIAQLIQYISTKKGDGAILVFVPGWAEISKLNDMLTADGLFKSNMFRIIPLHSLMPTLNQKQVFDRPPQGVRKIVIATNIAETSITIDDVVYVIDCGKIKVKDFQPENNLSTLAPQWVSKANAKQRRGRAGRVQPGECFHLYTGLKETELQNYLPPEMLRTRLEELCLQIKLLKLGRIEPFVNKAMNPPSSEALHRAITTLQYLNALDQDENLLPLGHHLAKMPVDPHVGKMILFGAMFCCLDPILTIAASLSFKDAFYIPLGKEKEADQRKQELAKGCKSDHLMLIKAFSGWERALSRGTNRQYCWDNFLSENTLKLLRDMKRQLAELLYDQGFLRSKEAQSHSCNINSRNDALVKAVICAGLYPNVAKLKKVPKPHNWKLRTVKLETADDRTVELHPKSVNSRETNFESRWMIYHKKLKTSSIYLHDCSMVSPYPLLFFGGQIKMIRDEEQRECVSIDDWIVFYCSTKTASLVKELRKELDKLLEEKITRTGATNWDPNSKEGALLRAIIDLVTTEEETGSYQNQSQGREYYR